MSSSTTARAIRSLTATTAVADGRSRSTSRVLATAQATLLVPAETKRHLGVAETLGQAAEPFGGVDPADLPVPVHEVVHAGRAHPLTVRVDVLEVHHDDHVTVAELGEVGRRARGRRRARRW